MSYSVNNVVATASLGTSIHLPLVVQRFPFCEYNRKKFAAMTVRLKNPCTTCLVFGSGRIVCTGSRTIMNTWLSIAEVWNIVREAGYGDSEVHEFRVQNMVANYDWGHAINLEVLSERYQAESNYNPELFPGLVMRFESTSIVYLVFASGKAVITGGQTEEEVDNHAQHLHGILTTVYGSLPESES